MKFSSCVYKHNKPNGATNHFIRITNFHGNIGVTELVFEDTFNNADFENDIKELRHQLEITDKELTKGKEEQI